MQGRARTMNDVTPLVKNPYTPRDYHRARDAARRYAHPTVDLVRSLVIGLAAGAGGGLLLLALLSLA